MTTSIKETKYCYVIVEDYDRIKKLLENKEEHLKENTGKRKRIKSELEKKHRLKKDEDGMTGMH